MGQITNIPHRILNASDRAATIEIGVYESGTSTEVNIYSDAGLVNALANPLEVLAGNPVPTIYHGFAGDVRVEVVDAGSNILFDDDPYDHPVSANALASTDGGKLVRLSAGETLQSAVNVAADPIALVALTEAFPEGSYIRTANGYLYEVASPDASDHHITTDGGSKLYVAPTDGRYHAPAFAISDAAGYQAMLDAVPSGALIFNPNGWSIDLDDGLSIDRQLTLSGSGLLNFISGVEGKAALQVNADGTVLDGLYLFNPDSLGNTVVGSARPYGVEIQANDVTVTNCRIQQFQNAIAQRANGEWYRSIITGNQCFDCLGAGRGQSSSSNDGEDRGDGITAWGAGTVIANNIITLKLGDDGRIGIHAERLEAFIVNPGPYDNTAVSVVNNHIYGAWRRGIAFEGMRGASAVGNTVVGSTWWALALLKGATSCTMSNNTVYWTQANTAWGSWAPTISPLKLGFELNSCSMSGNTVYMKAGSKCNVGFDMQNTADGVQIDCEMNCNKLLCEDDTVEFLTSLARISATAANFPVRPVFKGNTLRGDAPDGLLIQKCDSALVKENVIISLSSLPVAGSAGIQLTDTTITHPRIDENHVHGWADNILVASISGGGSISGNLIEAGGDGIVVGSSISGFHITRNRFGALSGNKISNVPNEMRMLVYDNDGQRLYTEATWDPANIVSGASVSTTFGVTGAAFGDFVEVAREGTLSGLELTAYVSATDLVTVKLTNRTGGDVNLSATQWRILVRKMGSI